MTKFLEDGWMAERGFIELNTADNIERAWWWNESVNQLKLRTPLTVSPTLTCQEAVKIMNNEGYDQIPVIDSDGNVQGMVTLGNLMGKLVTGKVTPTSPVSDSIYHKFKKVQLTTTLGALSQVLDHEYYALVTHQQCLYISETESTTKEIIFGIATRMDLLNYITKQQH